MTVTYDQKLVGFKDFKRVIEKAGFGITENTEETSHKKDFTLLKLIVAGVLSVLLLYVSMGQMFFENLPILTFADMNANPLGFSVVQILLCVPIMIIGKSFFTKGYYALFKGSPNMDSLVAVSSTASFIYSLVMVFNIPKDSSMRAV
jgi:Cu+-exporting ATPase